MKLGKKPYEPDARSLKLSKYLATDLPTPPKIFGYGTLFTDWGYLGNDKYGDCVFAGGGHEQMVWDTLRKGPGVKITTKNALSDYSAVTGFDPSDPNTDQGTYVIDAMKYRKATGLVDASGKRHKIAAYVEIDPTNWDELVTRVVHLRRRRHRLRVSRHGVRPVRQRRVLGRRQGLVHRWRPLRPDHRLQELRGACDMRDMGAAPADDEALLPDLLRRSLGHALGGADPPRWHGHPRTRPRSTTGRSSGRLKEEV